MGSAGISLPAISAKVLTLLPRGLPSPDVAVTPPELCYVAIAPSVATLPIEKREGRELVGRSASYRGSLPLVGRVVELASEAS
jgi:hypothetical protein